MALIEPGIRIDPRTLNVFVKLSGKTYKVKDKIKSMGYKWDPHGRVWIKKVSSIREIEEEIKRVVAEFWNNNEEVREHYLSLIPAKLQSELWGLVVDYMYVKNYNKVKRIASMLGIPLDEEGRLPVVYAHWEPYLKAATPEQILRIIEALKRE